MQTRTIVLKRQLPINKRSGGQWVENWGESPDPDEIAEG
jgi:hypothetical protein